MTPWLKKWKSVILQVVEQLRRKYFTKPETNSFRENIDNRCPSICWGVFGPLWFAKIRGSGTRNNQNVDKYSCQRSSSYKLDWITTGHGRIGDCLELEDTVWQTRWTPCGEVDPIQARVLLGYKWQNDTWTLRTLLPSLPTPAGISSLKWPKNRSTWITFMIIYQIYIVFFTQRMSWGRNLFVQMAKLWHKRRRRSGLGQTVHILRIGKPDNDVYIYRFYTKTKSSYSNWSTSWLLTSWGSCSGRGVWPPIPRGFADWTLGKLQMLPLECKRKSDLRPFFHPREWPLWNWTFSVGGTELRYLTRGRWMIHLEIPEVWSRQYWQVRGVALRERHAFALSHFLFFLW